MIGSIMKPIGIPCIFPDSVMYGVLISACASIHNTPTSGCTSKIPAKLPIPMEWSPPKIKGNCFASRNVEATSCANWCVPIPISNIFLARPWKFLSAFARFTSTSGSFDAFAMYSSNGRFPESLTFHDNNVNFSIKPIWRKLFGLVSVPTYGCPYVIGAPITVQARDCSASCRALTITRSRTLCKPIPPPVVVASTVVGEASVPILPSHWSVVVV